MVVLTHCAWWFYTNGPLVQGPRPFMLYLGVQSTPLFLRILLARAALNLHKWASRAGPAAIYAIPGCSIDAALPENPACQGCPQSSQMVLVLTNGGFNALRMVVFTHHLIVSADYSQSWGQSQGQSQRQRQSQSHSQSQSQGQGQGHSQSQSGQGHSQSQSQS